MISHTYQKVALIGFLGLIVISLTACGPRILVSTGTTLGLKATPGDGYTQPPQVTFGYKRAEVAFVPTKIQLATSSAGNEGTKIDGKDAFSVLAAVHFKTTWFGDTNLQSFVGTGIAARDVQTQPKFKSEFEEATLEPEQLKKLRSTAVDDIALFVIGTDKTETSKLKSFFTCSGRNEASAAKLAGIYAGKTKEEFIQAYTNNYAARAPHDRDNCVLNK